jgi:molybdopterin molybdotransferase
MAPFWSSFMIPYRQALDLILAQKLPRRVEELPLLEAAGRILAAPVHAPFPFPRFDNSAMDGFACRATDLLAAGDSTPVTLPIAGESAAGRRFSGAVPPCSAIRISTGAVLPPECDVIIPIEEVVVDSEWVTFRKPGTPGLYRRSKGADVAEGSLIAAAGTLVDARLLAFLASFNIPQVTVHAAPRVGVLTGGDEIRLHGEPLGPDDIIGSSLYFLESELRACHCEPRLYGVAPDDLEAYATRFQAMLEWADLLITTAGVSVGVHDIVGELVRRFGGAVLLQKLAVRPGKPMLVARYGDRLHIGFPGNPVSTDCNFEIFVKPLLRRHFGMEPAERPALRLPLLTPCPRDRGRLFFVYTRLHSRNGQLLAEPIPNQNSGNLSLCAGADALCIVEPGEAPLPVGELVDVLPLSRGLR